jgi:putative transposase
MHFEAGGIYHIYNQGNNRQPVFFSNDNYLFFLRKIRHHILPYADILAWCLMPNHFHLMAEVKTFENMRKSPEFSEGFTLSEALTKNPDPGTTLLLNHSIGVLLRSYTRAINAQEDRSGSLFRKKTKAICLNEINGISSHWYTSFGVTFMKVDLPEYQYPQSCFNYIHNNPVRAGLVVRAEDWEFSSYLDLIGIRGGSLVNRQRVDELGLIV